MKTPCSVGQYVKVQDAYVTPMGLLDDSTKDPYAYGDPKGFQHD